MNELQEFFKQAAEEKRVAIEKKRILEEQHRKLNPPIDFSNTDLGSFFGAVTTYRKEHILVERVFKREEDKQESKINALHIFFDKLNGFETALTDQIEKQKEPKEEVEYNIKPDLTETIKQTVEEPRVEQVQVQKLDYFKKNLPEPTNENVDITNLVSAMSSIIRPRNDEPYNKLSDLEKLQLEFKHFKNIVTRQMASIGGGGEVRLLHLDDVDTSSLGNGKFLAYNSTTKKLEFIDQVDGN